MQIHVKLVVSASFRGVSYYVPLPTYTGLSWDYVSLFAIVAVPDVDIPDAMQALPSSDYTTFPNGLTALSTCPADALAAWYSLLDSRYTPGKYRPEVG